MKKTKDDTTQEMLPDTIELRNIEVWSNNPRKDYRGDVTTLATDMGSTGVLQPLTLRKRSDGKWDLIIGVRRYKGLLALRGEDGVLSKGEFQIVSWDDLKCLRATVSENRERCDLAPIEEGRFLNNLSDMMLNAKEKVTDDLLAERTGIERQRVNDLRHLALKFDLLPESWKTQFAFPANCRLSDKNDKDVTLTPTHWKHVRGKIGDTIPPEVYDVMEKAAAEGWTSAKFKKMLDGLKTHQENTDQTQDPSEDKTVTADPIRIGKKVVKWIRAASDLLLPTQKYPNDPARLNEIALAIETRVAELESEAESKAA